MLETMLRPLSAPGYLLTLCGDVRTCRRRKVKVQTARDRACLFYYVVSLSDIHHSVMSIDLFAG